MRRFVGGKGGVGASSVTVTVRPATVSVPVRAIVVAATVRVTAPVPDPLAPAVTVIQLALLTAVHAQLVPEVTESVKVFPVDAAERVAGVTV
jgi:hypothetical protein